MKKKLVEIEVKLPKSLIKRINKICADFDISMDEFMENALNRFIEKYKSLIAPLPYHDLEWKNIFESKPIKKEKENGKRKKI